MTNQTDKPSVDGLLPCPWCGSNNAAPYSVKSNHSVLCVACGGEGPEQESDDEAIAAWNRRQSAAAPPIADAWMSEDGERVVPRSTKATADREGGASAAALRAYPVPLYAAPPSPVLLEVLEALKTARTYVDEYASGKRTDDLDEVDAAIAKLRELMGEKE